MNLRNLQDLRTKRLKKQITPKPIKQSAHKKFPDIYTFTEKLGYINAPHHKEIYEALTNTDIKRLLITAPPRHAKSTTASINFPCWLVAQNSELKCAHISYDNTYARSFIRGISGLLSHPKYVELMGNLKPRKPDKWTENQIIVNRPSGLTKDVTFEAIGQGSGIIGRGLDLIICDDIIDEDCAASERLRERIRDWFRNEVYSRLEPGGRIIVIGTRWHHLDLYSELMESKEWHHLHFKAIQEDGTALWERRWSLEKLLEIKRVIGSSAFECQYQGNPTGVEGAKFKIEWLHYWDLHKDDPNAKVHKLPDQTMQINMAFDLALGEKGSKSFFAGVVVGIDDTRNAWLLDTLQKQAQFPDQVKYIIDWN